MRAGLLGCTWRQQQEQAMQTTRLGPTGLEVTRLCLGCMSYGAPDRGAHPWTLDEAASRPLIRQAVEAGINFFDTANAYSDGTSEEIVGRALREYARRDEIVVATKVHHASRRAPNVGGLSRKAILHEIDASLRRLRMDHVDLYQIHRWDPRTPIEETMEALHDVVKAGKALYIGASSMHAWQFAKAQQVAERHGWTRFVSMQPELNLLYREEEREMLPLCRDQGVGVIPWSPLARGRLARPWGEKTPRIASDVFGARLFANTEDADRRVATALATVAAQRGTPRAQVALAWLLRKPGVTAPIVGVSRPGQLDDAVAALDIELTDAEVTALEAPYLPHAVVGFE
jgi:aryl-alcohol dehydrogenase-like predicted oxidoreductase